MLCPSCKKPITKPNDFCPHCGAFVPQRAAENARREDVSGEAGGISERLRAVAQKAQEYSAASQDRQKAVLTGTARTAIPKTPAYRNPQVKAAPSQRTGSSPAVPSYGTRGSASQQQNGIKALVILSLAIPAAIMFFIMLGVIFGANDFESETVPVYEVLPAEMYVEDFSIESITVERVGTAYVSGFTVSFNSPPTDSRGNAVKLTSEGTYSGDATLIIGSDGSTEHFASASFDGSSVVILNSGIPIDETVILDRIDLDDGSVLWFDRTSPCNSFTFSVDGSAHVSSPLSVAASEPVEP